MPKRKPTVQITNPAASRHKISRPLGTYSPTPPTPAPITPAQTPRSRQIVAGPRVSITDGRKAV